MAYYLIDTWRNKRLQITRILSKKSAGVTQKVRYHLAKEMHRWYFRSGWRKVSIQNVVFAFRYTDAAWSIEILQHLDFLVSIDICCPTSPNKPNNVAPYWNLIRYYALCLFFPYAFVFYSLIDSHIGTYIETMTARQMIWPGYAGKLMNSEKYVCNSPTDFPTSARICSRWVSKLL